MKTKIYTIAAIAACLVIASDSFGQRGRYYHHRHPGYAVRHSYRTYYYDQPYVRLSFGNTWYHYQGGYFYRPYGSYFQLVIPPFGIRIGSLPFGYRTFYVGPDPYYYYHGTYYRPYAHGGYQVVKPPLGAVLDELPPGAKVTVIDGKKYYELNGTYYEETITGDNELQYTVVGTDGVLDTVGSAGDNSNKKSKNTSPAIGDRFDDLPADCKAVVINGEKLYLSPSGLYYKEVIEGNKISYEVVGK